MARLADAPMEDYDKIFNVNVRSLIALTKLALPHLIKTKGNVVNISSVVAVKATPFSPMYAASKAAVDHFSRSLAADVGPQGVRVNTVNPGIIPDTSFFDRQGVPTGANIVRRGVACGSTVSTDFIFRKMWSHEFRCSAR